MHALLLTVFIDTVGFGIVLPLLPYFAEQFGAQPGIVPLLATVYSFTQFLMAPVWGRLSDKIGRRPIILITIAGIMLGYLWLAAAGSLLMLFLARAFTGAMASNGGVINAYVADVTSPQERAKGMGRMGAAHGLGFVMGPAIGGLLAGNDPANPNLQLPFLVAAALSAIALAIGWFQVRETVSAESRRAARARVGGRLAAFRDALGRPQLGLLMLILMMTPFVFAGVESVFVVWSSHTLGWGATENGWIYTFMGVVAVGVQIFVVGRLARAIGEHRAIRLGAVMIGLGVVLLPFMSGYVGLCVAFLLIVGGVCINNPSLNSIISQQVKEDERGRMLGISQSCSALARIIGPVWVGFAYGAFGPSWPFLSGALVMAVMFMLALRIVPLGPGDDKS
ncbi:MAG: DHA1 family tetracycline resistance protein-like MFS transporter [Alphaproteobacteria bacterium]